MCQLIQDVTELRRASEEPQRLVMLAMKGRIAFYHSIASTCRTNCRRQVQARHCSMDDSAPVHDV
jgi:hypothetical protein